MTFAVRKYSGFVCACSFLALMEGAIEYLGGMLAGNLLGETALAAVSLVSPILFVYMFFAYLIGNGMGTNYALRRGRQDVAGANVVFMQGIWTLVAVTLVMALAMVLLGPLFIRMMDPSPAIAEMAMSYWYWLIPAAILQPTTMFLQVCCYADGDQRLAAWAYVAQLPVNLLVTWVLMRSGWGVVGGAIGYSAGYLTAIAVLAVHFFSAKNTFRLTFAFRLSDSAKIFLSSVGDASSNLWWAAVQLVLSYVLVRQFGSKSLAAMAAFGIPYMFMNLGTGIGVAMQPVITTYYGEGNLFAVRMVMRFAVWLATAMGAVISLLFVIWPEIALRIMGIDDPDVSAVAIVATRCMAIAAWPNLIANAFNNYYQYIEREGLSVGISIELWLVAPIVTMLAFSCCDAQSFWWWCPTGWWLGLAGFAVFVWWYCGRRMFPMALPELAEDVIKMFTLRLDEREVMSTADAVTDYLLTRGETKALVMRARLLIEETLLLVRERNAGHKVLAEVTVDRSQGLKLTLRDDGVVFDITDTDQNVSGLRSFVVASMMERQTSRANLLTTGFNRNIFKLR